MTPTDLISTSDPMGPSGPSFIMVATIYVVLFIMAVMAITYPEEFPKLVRNPQLFFAAVGMESRRRWMIAKIGTTLFFERKRLQFSLWKARDIIAAERAKQQQQEPND